MVISKKPAEGWLSAARARLTEGREPKLNPFRPSLSERFSGQGTPDYKTPGSTMGRNSSRSEKG